MPSPAPLRVAVLHGAGYAGGELVRLLLGHPRIEIAAVTSRTFAGQPLHAAHAALRGVAELAFVSPDAVEPDGLDAAFVCAEHRQGAAAVAALRGAGFGGLIVDLSADHRLPAELYAAWYGEAHPVPAQIGSAVYGLAEVERAAIAGARLVANPGCFATALALALWPLGRAGVRGAAHVTALTGASGSGARASATTHFPTRAGNARAYRALHHRHLPEVERVVGGALGVRFVPASGPWTRGIWGTAHLALDGPLPDLNALYADAYADAPLVRLSPGALPELLPVVGTPFCDVGWTVRDGHAVVGVALDNLLKGAASQAVQNLNLALGLPETLGLLPA